MLASQLPSPLLQPIVVDGRVVGKLMQDLTVYLAGPSVEELDFLFDLYQSLCPGDRMVRYKISEFAIWLDLHDPEWTASSRAAAARGEPLPIMAPSRKRIREGRAFEAGLWDGLEIDAPDGSWSFNCRRIHLRESGLHAFVRMLLPLEVDIQVLQQAALAIADRVELHSGHGGLVFAYHPWYTEDALDEVYALARRYWGIDVEDLNHTLTLMKRAIKGVNWITLVGREFRSRPQIAAGLDQLAAVAGVGVHHRGLASLLVAGTQPVVGDQHRSDDGLARYVAVAKALEPLLLEAHPDFPSQRFIDNGNTLGWIRRFIDPGGWR